LQVAGQDLKAARNHHEGGFNMYKWVGTEIIAAGKMADYKAWWEARDKLLRERGLGTPEVYQVLGRENNMVLFDGPEFETWEEGQEYLARYNAIEEIQKLADERRERGVVLDGSTQWFILTDL